MSCTDPGPAVTGLLFLHAVVKKAWDFSQKTVLTMKFCVVLKPRYWHVRRKYMGSDLNRLRRSSSPHLVFRYKHIQP